MTREEFFAFLVAAKRATYAAQGDDATVAPQLPGSKQLEYRDGDYFYRDIYFGMAYFVGQEVGSYRDQPVWSMSYAGGVTPLSREVKETRALYAFLRAALLEITVAQPYRGPARFTRDTLTYANTSAGDFTAFWGHEAITRGGETLYELRYAGGMLAP